MWGSDLGRILETAAAAEALGFDAFYYGESPTPLDLETWTVLTAVAARTSAIRIGPVITNLLPSYRSFPLLVRQAHALAVVSRGRLDLRTGTGAASRWAQPWWGPVGVRYPGRAERRAVLDEWLAAYHHVWSTPTEPFHGAHVDVDEIRLEPLVERPPVTVAATGPAAMAVAAARADVWEASDVDPGGFAVLARRFDGLAGARGTEVVRAVEVDVVTATTPLARRRLERSFVAERAGSGRAPLERALRGSPDQVAEGIAAYVDAGADRLLAACVDPFDPDSLDALAEAGSRVTWR